MLSTILVSERMGNGFAFFIIIEIILETVKFSSIRIFVSRRRH